VTYPGGRHVLLSIVVALVWAASAGAAHAGAGNQSEHPSAPPNWNGVWVIAGDFMDKQDGTEVAAPGRFDPTEQASAGANLPAYKGSYLADYRATQKAIAEGKPVDDRGAQCLPQGMPAFWGGPYAFEILQTPDQINIYQEWNEQTRRIHLDERRHPAELEPSYNGHSIGHWEDTVLIVDTVAIRADTHMTGDAGGRHSDAIHIVERFRSEGPDRLEVTMTVHDPKAFSRPWIDVIHLHRKHGMEVMEYVCEENNRNPVSPAGVTGVTLGK
jgi:hypothetical protein